MTDEKRIQNAIISYLASLVHSGHPLYYERRQAGGFSYKKGQADLWACYNGKHIEIEVKRIGGQQSSMQEKWEKRCELNNIPYICVSSVDEVKTAFLIYFGVK